MKSYALFLIASLLFHISGILSISSGHSATGGAFIAVGCAMFVVVLVRRKRNNN